MSQLRLPYEDDDRDIDDILTEAGIDPRFTPIDTIMQSNPGVHLSVAHAMNGGGPLDD